MLRRNGVILLLILSILICSFIPSITAYPTHHVSFQEAANEIHTFFPYATPQNMILILGDRVSTIDQMVFEASKTQIEGFQNEPLYLDNSFQNWDNLSDNYEYIVLLGSQRTNCLSEEILSSSSFNITEALDTSTFYFTFGEENNTGRRVIILYNKNELVNAQNHAYERSPLNPFFGPKTVTVIATAASIIFLYLWNVFGSTIIDAISDYSSESLLDRKHKKKKVKRKEVQRLKLNEFIDARELLAIILSAVVFAIALSWTWAEDYAQMPMFILMTFIVVCLVLFIREYTRQYYCYKHAMRAEHLFWPFGAVLTIASTIIGNTFALAAYTLIDETEENKKIYGRINYRISWVLYLFVLVAFILNMFYPSLILQMAYVFTIMMLFIDMLPFSPMDGYEVRKYSFPKWLILYILLAVTYVMIFFNFPIVIS